MAIRGLAATLFLTATVAAVATACAGGGDGDEGGVTIDEPIGAPDAAADATGPSTAPSVVKNASLEVEVAGKDLSAAAQTVIDVATSSKVGGFLVSSVIDLERAHGVGNVVVKVPAPRFEDVVADLGAVGAVTRQQLEGQDLSAEFLATHAKVQRARARTAGLLSRLARTDDPGVRFQLREDLVAARNELLRLQGDEAYIQGQTSYSTIEVALAGKAPPAPPEKPAFERALGTAKAITVAIGSGAVLTAGVVVPLGALLAALYFLGAPIVRRVRPRLRRAEGSWAGPPA